MIADPEGFECDCLILQGAFVSHRQFGIFPPVCVFAESRSSLGESAHGVGVVD